MNIKHIRRKLATHTSEIVDSRDHERAAVAVVLREGTHSVEVLLIERAIFEGDPWSGHMAFPGGRMETSDDSTRITAARETYEEVGVQLTQAEYLGQIDEIAGNPRVRPSLVVSAHAFHLAEHQEFTLDPAEVQQAFWFPLAGLHDTSLHVEHTVPEMPEIRFPGVVVGDPDRHIVWGLTLRFLDRMMRVIEYPMREPWGDVSRYVDGEKDPHSD